MNKNIDLTKILKDCPKGTKLYSTVYGVVRFDEIDKDKTYPISIYTNTACIVNVTSDGRLAKNYNGECTLFPSKDQRDWSKFNALWMEKEIFDPKTLKPFDKVLVRDGESEKWNCNIFSFIDQNRSYYYRCIYEYVKYCIPYNDDTKYLLGTQLEAPEYYRYWKN